MSALIEVRVPGDQAEGSRAQVLRWLKSVGDPVALHEPLLELETDKVTVEVASPAAGVLREILKQPQQDVWPDDVVARLQGPATTATTAAAGAGGAPAALGADGADAAAAGSAASTHACAASPGGRERHLLSPAVRRLLADRRLDATQIAGSGRGGRITAGDVLRHAARPDEGIERVPHSAMRRRIAARMVESLLHTAPHVTSVFEADLGAVLAHRAAHRAEFERAATPLTLTAYFALACVAAIRAVPEANSRWTEAALEIHRRIDLGIATALDDGGLVVPVLRDVQSLDLHGVARQLAELTRRAREHRLAPADVRDGTFTISNHGVSGSVLAAPIVINQPQSAILGIGRVEKRVVVVAGECGDAIAVRPRCYVTLTVDHRALDGQSANRFLQVLVARLESWIG